MSIQLPPSVQKESQTPMVSVAPPPPQALPQPKADQHQKSHRNRASIETAVSLLAKQQQLEIERLMEQQAKEREQLRALFQKQQV